jgi:hypothetical protein
MKRLAQFTFTFVLGVVAGCLAIPAVDAQFRATKTTRLLTTDLAGWCDGKEVTVEISEPGHQSNSLARTEWPG